MSVTHKESSDYEQLHSVAVCDLCGADAFEAELECNGWRLMKCKRCGLVFTSPRYNEQELRDLYVKQFYEQAPDYLSGQLAAPSQDIVSLAKSYKCLVKEIDEKSKAKRSLDVGCGGGNAVAAFKSSGWEAVGIDPSQKAINFGRQMGLDLRSEDLDSDRLGKFDLITAFHVLEHVDSPRSFLTHCSRHLRDYGLLLIEVPNYGCRRSRYMGSRWPYLHPHHHLYQFTRTTLKSYLQDSGFHIVRMRSINGRGPFESHGSPKSCEGRLHKSLSQRLYSLRHSVFRIPGSRAILAYLFWELLSYGEFLRVLARKRKGQ